MLETVSTTVQYVQTMFDCLKIYRKDAHSSNYNMFQEGRKGVIPKIWFIVLEEYHIMHSEK